MAAADVTYDELLELTGKEGVVIVDVREPAEIEETGKLPGSIHIPLGSLQSELETSPEEFKSKHGVDKPTTDSPLVFSCKAGRRGQTAVENCLALGYKDCRNFEGGFLNWQKNNQ